MFQQNPRILTVALSLALGLSGAVVAQDLVPTEPARFAEDFPAGTVKNLNVAAGPNTLDLSLTVGEKPIVLVYWIPGNPRADKLLKDIENLVAEVGKDKVSLFAVSFQQPGRDVDVARARAAEMGLKIPVIDDEGFVLGQRLRVQSVPNVTLIDSDGKLRLTNGASLFQTLEYQMNLENAIRRMGRNGRVGTYGYLAPYHPVNELVGKRCPDFEATFLGKSEMQSWYKLIDDTKVNILIFWSVDCPHCRQSLPELNAWLKANREGVNVFSAAKVTSEASQIKTREFCDLSEFVFPTLEDRDMGISRLYQVTSTPTILIIGPDGVIDSVMLSGYTDFGAAIEKKKRELLKQG